MGIAAANDYSTAQFGSRLAVVSPHLDDAALSVGATIAWAVRNGVEVSVVTVFAYDPDRQLEPGAWDKFCGFRSSREAAIVRRREDAESCALMGARPVWLPFMDVEYDDGTPDDQLAAAIIDAVSTADTVLLPGYPLTASDHLRVTRLLLERPVRARLALYVEQPYASWRLLGRGRRTGAAGLSLRRSLGNAVAIGLRTSAGRRLLNPQGRMEHLLPRGWASTWDRSSAGLRDWRIKHRAVKAHRSQGRSFGPLVVSRVALYEWGWGGEGLGWLKPASTLTDHDDD